MVIKRNGAKVAFDKCKIVNAIQKAMACTTSGLDLNLAEYIANKIEAEANKLKRDISIEEIQDLVEDNLMQSERKDVARAYILWREQRRNIRENEKTNDSILQIIDSKNKDINEENSNKNPAVLSTQRDYMAGEVSKDLTKKLLLPKDIVDAHENGLIHFHK